jgi:hypothetical protein
MKTTRRWREWCGAGLGVALVALTGCQTWTAGMTLPSGHYLQHPPQFFGPGPAFPLTRELSRMEEQGAAGLPGAPAPLVPAGPGGPLPPQVPAGPPPP